MIRDKTFNYTRIDTAFCYDGIDKIRFINEYDSTEHYLEFFANGNIETGYLKYGLPYGNWKVYDINGKVINSLEFDTLKVKYNDVLSFTKNRRLDPKYYDVSFIHNDYLWGDTLAGNYWSIIKLSEEGPTFSIHTGYSINAISGEIKPDTIRIFFQPVIRCQCDKEPSFKGGEKALKKFIAKNSIYPIDDYGKNGVFVSFTVLKDGTIENINVGCSNTGYFKREVIRVMQQMPGWIPAKKEGRSIECRHGISFNFK